MMSSFTPLVVQKFGGTSLGHFAREIAINVIKPITRERTVVVVCSARSLRTKAEGTTALLLRAAHGKNRLDEEERTTVIDVVLAEHLDAVDAHITSIPLRQSSKQKLVVECDDLSRLVQDDPNIQDSRRRARDDTVISKGERLSCLFMAAVLEDQGIHAECVDLAYCMPISYGLSKDLPKNADSTLYHGVADKLAAAIRPVLARGHVPVVTGFFGRVHGGLLKVVGRGYTDFCAALIATGLGATDLQIWKEFGGIFTADPTEVSDARLLNSISPAEAAELTFYGAEVLHPASIAQDMRGGVPISVKCIKTPDDPGTIIHAPMSNDEVVAFAGQTHHGFQIRSPKTLVRVPQERPAAITSIRNIAVININCHQKLRTSGHKFFQTIFSILDKWRLSIDLFASSECQVSLALHSPSATDDKSRVSIVDHHLIGAFSELSRYGTVDILIDMAIISLVGEDLKSMIGIAGSFLTVFGDNGDQH